MAASRPCPRWELFLHPSRSRCVTARGKLELSRLPSALSSVVRGGKHYSKSTDTCALYNPTVDRRSKTIARPMLRPQPRTLHICNFDRPCTYGTSAESENGSIVDNTLSTDGTTLIRKRGRPPGARNKRSPLPLANTVQQRDADDVGIPFGARRDVASKWQDLAGLDVDENLYHRNIWWLWLEKCNGAWTESSFDVTKAWRQQNLDKRVLARESVKGYVYDEDIVGLHVQNESAEWKDKVKKVLGSDAGIDFKLARIHGSYRRAWTILKEREESNSARRSKFK